MGENTVWLVPIDQDRWRGRGGEVANALWNEGIVAGLRAFDPATGIVVNDDFIYDRRKQWRSEQREIPESPFAIEWDQITIDDLHGQTIVPQRIDDLCCPRCRHDVSWVAYQEAWTWGVQDISKQFLHCPNCGENFISTDVCSVNTRFRWASFLLTFSDVPHPESLNEDLMEVMEEILGKCEEFRAWST